MVVLMAWIEFLRSLSRGKSARRALLNTEVARHIKVAGMVLDVGGKGNPSYRKILPSVDQATWVILDIALGEGMSVCGDLTSLPFNTNIFDAVICFNVLEHVYEYRVALGEMYRVLKPHGVLYGYVPFICNVHPDPSDYWRFTEDCLNKCLSEAGFSVDVIVPHGGVFLSCFDLTSFVVKRLPPLRILWAALLLLADALINYVRPSFARRFPVGYFFIARKFG
jgi:SAM-dependent methyltransferase